MVTDGVTNGATCTVVRPLQGGRWVARGWVVGSGLSMGIKNMML